MREDSQIRPDLGSDAEGSGAEEVTQDPISTGRRKVVDSTVAPWVCPLCEASHGALPVRATRLLHSCHPWVFYTFSPFANPVSSWVSFLSSVSLLSPSSFLPSLLFFFL